MDIIDNNISLTEQPKSPISKKLLAVIILFFILAGSVAWYFFYFIKTPEYSLNLVKESIEKHDVAKFNKHADLDSILSRGYDDLILAMIDSDKTLKPEGKTLISGFAQMFKATAVGVLKDGTKRFVETGVWDEKSNQEVATKNESQSNISPEKLINTSGLKNSSFKGIAYTKKDGKIATVGLKILEKDINKEFIVDLKMRELDDGSWQIAEISNLKEYITAIENGKNELLKKYIEDTQPIIDKHNKILEEIDRKTKTILTKSTLSNESKEIEYKNIIENEVIPDWNNRIEELNKITLPEAAKELHKLRLKVCELRLQQLQKNIEWINNKNPQINAEMNNLVTQSNNANQQALSIIKKVKSATN